MEQASASRRETVPPPLRFARILVAYDGSGEAAAGWRLAAALARGSGARLTLAYVGPSAGDVLAGSPTAIPGLEELVRRQEADWEARLDGLLRELGEGVEASAVVLHGDPTRALLDHAEQESIDLVVAGSHGVGASRSLLGSVSSRLLDHAPCSVLLVRRTRPVRGLRKVLVAVDGSEHSRRALAAAQALAADLGAVLVLVHAAEVSVPFAITEPDPRIRDLVRAHGERLLRDAAATVSAPLESVRTDLRLGAPRPELLRAAEEHAPLVLVAGTRGLHGFRGLVTGSVARELVNHASCPVLVVREPAPRAGGAGSGDGGG